MGISGVGLDPQFVLGTAVKALKKICELELFLHQC